MLCASVKRVVLKYKNAASMVIMSLLRYIQHLTQAPVFAATRKLHDSLNLNQSLTFEGQNIARSSNEHHMIPPLMTHKHVKCHRLHKNDFI